jgi:hypothetical protein
LEEHNAASDPIVKAIAVRNAAAATQNELVKQVSAAANALPGSVFQHDWANVAMLENMGSSKATSYRQMMVDYYVANKSQWPTDLASTPNVIQNEGRFMRNPVLGSHQLSSWGIPKP